MDARTISAVVVFVAAYACIVSDKMHKAVAAIAGACMMILIRVLNEKEAFAAIDLNVIFLLMGMMIMVNLLAESGFFGFVAIRLAQLSRGRPIPLLLWLCIVTACLSALVDNVTTVLLTAPVTFIVTGQLGISPVPYLLFEALASNIGGTATLIGDPPNILISSASGLSFNEFATNLGPASAICLAALLPIAAALVRKGAYVSSDIRAKVMEMEATRAITDSVLLRKTGLVLALVLALFIVHDKLGLAPSTVALAGATILLVITKADPAKAFAAVEWPALAFFVGLFVLVEGLRSVGLLDIAARLLLSLTHNDLLLTSMAVLWLSGLTAAFIGAIPVVATLIPVIRTIVPSIAHQGSANIALVQHALWWSLALGACLGGNGTVFGAAANIVAVEIAHKNGHRVTFGQFLRYGLPVTLMSLLISSLYVLVRYVG